MKVRMLPSDNNYMYGSDLSHIEGIEFEAIPDVYGCRIKVVDLWPDWKETADFGRDPGNASLLFNRREYEVVEE